MANHCSIKLKISKEDLISDLKQHFKEKFNLNLIHNEEKFGDLFLINGLEFPFWIENNKFETFDTMSVPLYRKANYTVVGEKYRLSVLKKYGMIFELACAYSYLFNYMNHYIAKINETYIDSDGIGKITPFEEDPKKFYNFKTWFEYFYQDNYRSKITKFVTFINKLLRAKTKAYQSEKQYFPELFN